MKCVIIASGNFEYTPKIKDIINRADLIICADGGTQHLKSVQIDPDIIIGDMDSTDHGTQSFFKSKKIPIIQYPEKKNETDTELCIFHAIEKGAEKIILLGVTGTRLDHTLANILLLKKLAAHNIPACVIDPHNEVYLVLDTLTLTGKPGQLLSIIPVTHQVTGITLAGLEYPLNNATLYMADTLGISNVFKEERVSIRIKSGILIVTKSRD